MGPGVNKWSAETCKDIPDEEILWRAVKEPEIFRVIVERYEAPFMRKARNILYAKEDAEEIVQDAFTRIYMNAARFKVQEGATFASWGYAILTRLAFTRYQKVKKRRGATAPLEPEHYERLPDKADFVEDLSAKDEIIIALAKLPEAAARILRLQFLEGKSQEEIAMLEESTVPAVKTRVHRAKKLFKDIYEQQHKS
ncbi:MAG: RNA polymerase sigma factor [Minisyncoccia bacterium]